MVDADVRPAVDKLKKVIDNVSTRARTVDGKVKLQSMAEWIEDVPDRANACDLDVVMHRLEVIRENLVLYLMNEKADAEKRGDWQRVVEVVHDDRAELEDAIEDLRRGIVKVFKEKCGCRLVV